MLKPRRAKNLAEKIEVISAELEELVLKHHPEVCGLETVFYRKNPKSAMLSSQLRGAFILLLTRHNIQILEFAPARIKLALTGNGRASKAQVQFMIDHLFKINKRISSDASDALAIAYCAAKR